MVESRKAKRLVWIVSLTLGPVVYCILLLTLLGTPNIEVIKKNIIDLLVSIFVCWVVGFVLVWTVHCFAKFMLKYGPFV